MAASDLVFYGRHTNKNVTVAVKSERRECNLLPYTLMGMDEGDNVAGVFNVTSLHGGVQRGGFGDGAPAPDLLNESQPKTVTYTILCDMGVGDISGTRNNVRDFTEFLRGGVSFARHGDWGGIAVDGYLADTPQVVWQNSQQTEAVITFTLTYTTPFLTHPFMPSFSNVTQSDYYSVTEIIDGSATIPAFPHYSAVILMPFNEWILQSRYLMSFNIERDGVRILTCDTVPTNTQTVNVNAGETYFINTLGVTRVTAEGVPERLGVGFEFSARSQVLRSGFLLLPPSQSETKFEFAGALGTPNVAVGLMRVQP